MSVEIPRPWSDDVLNRLNAVKLVKDKIDEAMGLTFDDKVGERVAALRFEILSCLNLQVEDLQEADELLAGLRECRELLDEAIVEWSRCVAGGVG